MMSPRAVATHRDPGDVDAPGVDVVFAAHLVEDPIESWPGWMLGPAGRAFDPAAESVVRDLGLGREQKVRIFVLRDELRFVHVGRAVHEDAAVTARANLLGELHAIVEAGLVGRRIAGEPRVMKIENERVGLGLVVVRRHEEAVRHRHAAELEDSTP